MVTDEILTAREAAEFLKISTLTLRKKIRQSHIPAHRMGRKWIFIKSEVMEWLKRQ
jgi:excisionase family DNA binding protein